MLTLYMAYMKLIDEVAELADLDEEMDIKDHQTDKEIEELSERDDSQGE
jgi:hypothetical protein